MSHQLIVHNSAPKLNTWIANPFYHMILGHEAHGLTGEAVFSGTSRAEGG